MGFSIGFTTNQDPDLPHEARGRIAIGTWAEEFVSPIDHWSRSQYVDQWFTAIENVVVHHSPAALITAMVDPEQANFIRWWPLYPEGTTVYVQEHLLLFENLDEPFDAQDPFRSIPPRRASEDGERISQWSVPISALRSFITQVTRRPT